MSPRETRAMFNACDLERFAAVQRTTRDHQPSRLAMAAAVPIVATDVGACREVLDGGRCGLYVEPSRPEAMAEGIRQVLSDLASVHQLERAAAARQPALGAFSVAAMAAAYGRELFNTKTNQINNEQTHACRK